MDEEGRSYPLDSTCLTPLEFPQGLLVKYYENIQWEGKPILEERVPSVNYTNGNDFSTRGGSASWEGGLEAPVAGRYQFDVLTNNQCRLLMDGREVVTGGDGGTGWVRLGKGHHSLKLMLQAPGGFSSLSLLWVKPGSGIRQVIPLDAFD
jgi:hypothetical protein